MRKSQFFIFFRQNRAISYKKQYIKHFERLHMIENYVKKPKSKKKMKNNEKKIFKKISKKFQAVTHPSSTLLDAAATH